MKTEKRNPSISDKKKDRIKKMIDRIDNIIAEADKYEKIYKTSLKKVHPDNLTSARNLIHYRSLRLHDMSDLQKQLGYMGLSRMAHVQGNVLAGLQSTKTVLRTFLGKPPKPLRAGLSFKRAKQLSKKNTKALLGYRSKGRHTRIMVTMPSEASQDYQLVESMIRSGMNCARINCAHDTEVEWYKMIENIRNASKKLKKRCKVAMDLAGPKIRTGPLVPGPKVIKLRPQKDIRGRINSPLVFWIGNEFSANDSMPSLPVSRDHLIRLEEGNQLYFEDARGKKRSIVIIEKLENECLASIAKTCYFETGMKLFFNKIRQGNFIPVGELPELEIPIVLKEGDYLHIDGQPFPGEPAKFYKDGSMISMAHVSCTAPEIFNELNVGEPILFDDGKIGGTIEEINNDHFLVRITQALEKGGKLRADKGMNFPKSKITIDGLTKKDEEDLKFVIQHADVVNMSFVNRKEDVRQLLIKLKRLKANPELGVIIKIETQSGFDQLTEIVLEAMRLKSIGVMIARGDLAIEVGWENIGRIQQEILSLCEAAHISDIWATQVLENLAKRGLPSRAEITDVIKAQQADCVMLNKGPFILDSIEFLDRILKDMEPFREKSDRLTPAMRHAVPEDDQPVNLVSPV